MNKIIVLLFVSIMCLSCSSKKYLMLNSIIKETKADNTDHLQNLVFCEKARSASIFVAVYVSTVKDGNINCLHIYKKSA
jgi:hypothetical protein